MSDIRPEKPRQYIPDYVDIFPEIAQAALRGGEEQRAADWSLLRAADEQGSGRLPRLTARRTLEQGRLLSERDARRHLRNGDGRWWTLDQQYVWPRGPVRVAEALGIDRLSQPHRIPVTDLQHGTACLRAALAATAYRTDEYGRPLSRRRVRELTGVPESTQRRYENKHGHAATVEAVHVELTHVTGAATTQAWVSEYSRAGMYLSHGGSLMRRHPDIRKAAHHQPGSASAARRANQHLAKSARGDRPATKARGERFPRAFFPLSPTGKTGHARWVKAKAALGKAGSERWVSEAVFDYAVIAARKKGGGMRFESAAIPSEHSRGQSLSRSFKAGTGWTPSTPPSQDPADADHSRSNNVRPQRGNRQVRR